MHWLCSNNDRLASQGAHNPNLFDFKEVNFRNHSAKKSGSRFGNWQRLLSGNDPVASADLNPASDQLGELGPDILGHAAKFDFICGIVLRRKLLR